MLMGSNKSKKGIIALIVGFIIVGMFWSVSKINGGANMDLIKNYDEYYNAVKDGLTKYESSIIINVKDYDKGIYNLDVVEKVLENNPELVGNIEKYHLKAGDLVFATQIQLDFNYYESKDILISRETAVKNKVDEIVSNVIKPEMKDYEKEKALHDYVINNCKFDSRYESDDMPRVSYSAYGALINGLAVCQGYAVAMDKLLTAVGIKSTVISGQAMNSKNNSYINHAWNIIELGGQSYHLDLTWDDPIMDNGSDKLRYSYFNITDEQIKKNHKWDENKYPKCTSTEYSFNNLKLEEKDSNGNNIIVVQDYDEFSSYIKEDILELTQNKTYKIINFDGDKESIKSFIEDAYRSLGKGGRYTYYYEIDDILKYGYVKVSFN